MHNYHAAGYITVAPLLTLESDSKPCSLLAAKANVKITQHRASAINRAYTELQCTIMKAHCSLSSP